jgi:tetratricopeptide (TPR) repeat protein
MDLDRYQEAHDLLDPLVGQLDDDAFADAERLWAQILVRMGWVDGAILSARSAARAAKSNDLIAAALAWSAVGYANKRCWELAEKALREAIELAPNLPRVLIAQARVKLEADQRLEARAIYERLAGLGGNWAKAYGEWGQAHVAYLLGEFDQARRLAEMALSVSPEIVNPIFVLAQVALALEDAPSLAEAVQRLEARSPQAQALTHFKEELDHLQQRLAPPEGAKRKRLAAFPSMVQRRDYCGPSTIELVLRYWKDGPQFTNDEIAQAVKFPHSGTPIYRMREFFHLIGFDTRRGRVPADMLRQLIDRGIPAIIQEEFSNSSHVAVVIGYDETAGTIELQDPMTHAINATPVDELARLRQIYLESAIVAFPRGRGLDKTLARLGLFDDPVVVDTDQAILEMDEDRPQAAADLMARAVQKQPAHALSWIMRLHAELELWRRARRDAPAEPVATARLGSKLRSKKKGATAPDAGAAARQRFYTVLEAARQAHPQAEFIAQFEGSGALLDQDLPRAQEAFKQATERDPGDARNFSSLAECQFNLRQVEAALDAAMEALARDPSLATANAWAGRSLAYLNRANADHYAQSAVELASDWWLAHQALAEAYFRDDEQNAAHRQVDLALSLAPEQPEARVLHARLIAAAGDLPAAADELDALLSSQAPLAPMTAYQAHQALCRVLFGAQEYASAGEQVLRLLELTPDDPWAVQFKAAARCEALLQLDEPQVTAEMLVELRGWYDAALQANGGAVWVARDYVFYFSRLAGMSTAVEIATQVRQAFPDNGHLIYLQGQYLGHAGQAEPAAQAMLEALGRADGISDRDELYTAVNTILRGLGLAAGEQALLAAPIPDGSAPEDDRLRALGLALALHPAEAGERARALLTAALNADPDDAFAALRLGDVTQSAADREALYRRALMLAPRWAYARANLADYLVDDNRAAEALEFTSGHERESAELLSAHGRALLGVGRCEEAVAVFTEALAEADEPDNWLLMHKWWAQQEAGQHAAALETAQDGLGLFPKDLRWYLRRAGALRSLDRLDEAAQAVAEAQAQGLEPSDVLRAEYENAWARKDYTAALEVVDKLIGIKGEQAGDQQLGRWEERRLQLLIELDRVDEARQFIETENLDAEGLGDAAWTVMMTEAHTFTLELAERCLAADPENFSGLYTRAQALSDIGREAEALEAFNRLREVHPDEHNAYEKLAVMAAVDGDPQEGLVLADRAVALGAFCPYAWAARGYANFICGQREAARTDLEMAWNRADVQRRRKSYDYWWLLAELQGDQQLAAERKQLAIAEAETPFGKRILAQIEKLLEA